MRDIRAFGWFEGMSRLSQGTWRRERNPRLFCRVQGLGICYRRGCCVGVVRRDSKKPRSTGKAVLEKVKEWEDFASAEGRAMRKTGKARGENAMGWAFACCVSQLFALEGFLSDVASDGLGRRELRLKEEEDPKPDGCGSKRRSDVTRGHPSIGGLGLCGVGIGVLVKVGACDAVVGLLSQGVLVCDVSSDVSCGCERAKDDTADQRGPSDDTFGREGGLLLSPCLIAWFGEEIEVVGLRGLGLYKDFSLKRLVTKASKVQEKVTIWNKKSDRGDAAVAFFDEDLCACR